MVRPGLRASEEAGRARPWCAAGLGSGPGGEGASSSRGGRSGEGPGTGPACLAAAPPQPGRALHASRAPSQLPSASGGNRGGTGWRVMPHSHCGWTWRASRLLSQLLRRQGKHHSCGHPPHHSCVPATRIFSECKPPAGTTYGGPSPCPHAGPQATQRREVGSRLLGWRQSQEAVAGQEFQGRA